VATLTKKFRKYVSLTDLHQHGTLVS